MDVVGLTNVWETKPLLDGHQIMDALNLGKGGKQVQEWVSRLSLNLAGPFFWTLCEKLEPKLSNCRHFEGFLTQLKQSGGYISLN